MKCTRITYKKERERKSRTKKRENTINSWNHQNKPNENVDYYKMKGTRDHTDKF
jgi:hypothetical protein